jgi:hypothetical protein
MVGISGVGGRAGEAFFQVVGCSQARASTAFTTVGWGMSHDPRQHMSGGHDTILDRLAQHFQDVTPTRREFFQTIRSGVRATPCPASTPVRYSSGQPTHTRRARCPRSAARLGPIWRLSASLPGRTRVLAGPGHDHQQPRVRRLPSGTCGSSPGSRWGADEAPVVAPPPGGGTGGVPRSLDRPQLIVMSVRSPPRGVGGIIRWSHRTVRLRPWCGPPAGADTAPRTPRSLLSPRAVSAEGAPRAASACGSHASAPTHKMGRSL